MLESLAIAVGGIVAIMILWVVVQSMWGKVFADHKIDEDVLAGRTDCGNCGCKSICQREQEKPETSETHE